jgi:methylated-DNA-[protein]-cysteine S-methyltransferase
MNFPSNMTFAQRVRAVVATIPKGQVMTYKQVAALAGSPGAYRAVGNILSKNFDPRIPCHRVVRSDGLLGGYNRGAVQKSIMLAAEGAVLNGDNS